MRHIQEIVLLDRHIINVLLIVGLDRNYDFILLNVALRLFFATFFLYN